MVLFYNIFNKKISVSDFYIYIWVPAPLFWISLYREYHDISWLCKGIFMVFHGAKYCFSWAWKYMDFQGFSCYSIKLFHAILKYHEKPLVLEANYLNYLTAFMAYIKQYYKRYNLCLKHMELIAQLYKVVVYYNI